MHCSAGGTVEQTLGAISGSREEARPSSCPPSEKVLPWDGHFHSDLIASCRAPVEAKTEEETSRRGSSLRRSHSDKEIYGGNGAADSLESRPRPHQEQAVDYFFEHAESASMKGQPLRFHMSKGRVCVYGMIVVRDLRNLNARAKGDARYVLFVSERCAARDIAEELVKLFPDLRIAIVGDDDECGGVGCFNFWICDYEMAGFLAGQSFRIKIVEEAPQFQRGTPTYNQIRQEVKSELVVHFTGKGTENPKDLSASKAQPRFADAENEPPNSWFGWLTRPYDAMWKAIIRPPRAQYSLNDLGVPKFVFANRVCERQDLQLKNYQGHTLECSHFTHLGSKNSRCIIYLHGNCSSRLEVFYVLPTLLSRGLAVFAMDLSGSGWSGGEYISLGHHEEQDVKVVLSYLRESGYGPAIGIWGRSMGAASAVIRAGKDQDIAAMVLDSPFSDLGAVSDEYIDRMRLKVPEFLLSICVTQLRSEVQSRAGFDPYEVVPLKSAKLAACPALFGVAMDDCFILPHHTIALYNSWAGERVLSQFFGGHSGRRPGWFLDQAADFLVDRLEAATVAWAKGRRLPKGRELRRTFAL